MPQIPFDRRASFVAGQAKSGTTLLVALLDNHPQLLALPEETAYFPTVLTKYRNGSRQAQFDYLTERSLSNVLFGGQCKWGRRDYSWFPRTRFLEIFRARAFAPGNADRDLLVLMVEAYAEVLGRNPETLTRWIEKTPANRNHLDAIHRRFPEAKILLTMRDPRAILSAQIALEKSRQLRTFSTYYVIAHWRTAAGLALRDRGRHNCHVVFYEQLVQNASATMQEVCAFLEIDFLPEIVLQPTKAGTLWRGNSAAETPFSSINTEPVSRWENDLSEDEIGWVEWHCRDLMPRLGYEPRLRSRALRHFLKPVRYEVPREYLKSRLYSLRDSMKSASFPS